MLRRWNRFRSEEKKAELRAKGYGFYASGALESLTKLTYDEIVEQEIGFIGTPEKIIRQIRALQEKGGIGELAIVSNFGGLEHWKSVKIQHMFAKHVMPAFRAGRNEAKSRRLDKSHVGQPPSAVLAERSSAAIQADGDHHAFPKMQRPRSPRWERGGCWCSEASR